MASNNLAVILYGKDDLRLEHRPISKLKSNEALLQIECVGICGSDIHFWIHGLLGTYILESPVVIGHEASGTVVQVGSDVQHLKPGDRVAIEPGVPCGNCNYCREGNYHLCGKMIFCACPPCDGNLSQFFSQSADFLYKLPDHVSLEEGALIEPLSVAVHACKLGKVTANSTIFIAGAGPIGLITLLAARAYGATKILVADLLEFRLQQAKQLGADYVLKIDSSSKEKNVVTKIIKMFENEGPDISFDCTGVESCVRIGVLATKKKGAMVLVGMGKAEMTLPIFEAQCKEVDIRGCFRYCNDYPTALGLVSSGKISLKPLVTHHYKMEEYLEAFKTAHSGKDSAIKVIIHPNSNRKA